MYCQRCRATIPDNATFCSFCGAAVQRIQSVAAPPYAGFMCPFCRTQNPPFVSQQVSSGGWVLFVILVLFCLPLCWLPFVLDGCKEEARKCSVCGAKVG